MTRIESARVFITGASGFIGANLSHALLPLGAEVHGLVRPGSNRYRLETIQHRIKLWEGDLNNQELTSRYIHNIKPDFIFNCAFPGGHGGTDSENNEMLRTGVNGSYNLLLAAGNNKVRKIIHLGSSTEYGNRIDPCSEEDVLDPVSIRGAAKAVSTILYRQFARENQFPLVILRLFSVFGPWESKTRLIPSACLAALRNRPMQLTSPGFSHDFIFIEDVIQACVLAVEKETAPGAIINIGSGKQHVNETVVKMVEEIGGILMDKTVGTYPLKSIDHTGWVADISKAKKILGWHPNHDLRGGLEKTFQWWGENVDRPWT
jgi:nucleoside-diphosphate-sugar epimerase